MICPDHLPPVNWNTHATAIHTAAMTNLLPSSPDYPLYDELWRTYAIALNPQCWMVDNDMEAWDMTELTGTLEDLMQALLDGLPSEFVEWRVTDA